MLQDLKTNHSEECININKINNEVFSFLLKENISQEEFENQMNHLLSFDIKEKESQFILLSIKEETIISMIKYSIKFNNTILVFKLIVNLS